MRLTASALVSSLSLLACGTAPSNTAGDASTSTSSTSTGESTGAPTTSSATTSATTATTGEPAWPDACAEPIPAVPRSSARLAVDADGRLRDEQNRDIQLRGVNTGGRSKWAPFVPFLIDPGVDLAGFTAAADTFYSQLPAWGVDVVRMPFSWEALEPTPGTYDERYLDRYAAMVDVAWSHGLAVIVDFHQDIYASPLCGDGFPPWTLPGEPGPPRHDCKDWGFKYLTDSEVRGAFERFWTDEDMVQAKFLAMWQALVDRIGDHPGVLGLEILNEPGWGDTQDIDQWKQDILLPFWNMAIADLRDHAGDDLLILYDNTGLDAVALTPLLHLRPDGDNLMYAPHYYDPALVKGMPWSGSEPLPLLTEIATFAAASGVAVLLGEFGYSGDAPKGGPEWLTRTYDALDSLRLSSTQWECSVNEEPWNFEDLSMLTPDGAPRPVVDVFARPRLRALAGTDASFTWDSGTGSAVATWTGDGGISEIVVPAWRFSSGLTDLSLETVSGPPGACLTHDASRSEIRVSVPAGAAVSVRLTGSPR